jgi:hypothetical protein
MSNSQIPQPVFHIKLQDSPEKGSSQKSSKTTIEKLVLSKNVVFAHVHKMINGVIEMSYDIKAANSSTSKCKKLPDLFCHHHAHITQQHAATLNLITILGPYFICDTISLH